MGPGLRPLDTDLLGQGLRGMEPQKQARADYLDQINRLIRFALKALPAVRATEGEQSMAQNRHPNFAGMRRGLALLEAGLCLPLAAASAAFFWNGSLLAGAVFGALAILVIASSFSSTIILRLRDEPEVTYRITIFGVRVIEGKGRER